MKIMDSRAMFSWLSSGWLLRLGLFGDIDAMFNIYLFGGVQKTAKLRMGMGFSRVILKRPRLQSVHGFLWG